MPTTTDHRPEQDTPAHPLLFGRREYLIEADGSTTTCVASNTSPVNERTPDD